MRSSAEGDGTDRNTSQQDQQKKTDTVWACGERKEENKRLPTKALYCYVDGKRSIGRQKRHGFKM